MKGFPFRLAPFHLAIVCAAAGSLGACAHSAPPMAPLGMAEAEPAPRPMHHFFINPFFHRASYERPATRLSSASPIALICATPEGKAVLDRDLPGLTTRAEYDFFKHMSLRTLKSMSGGKLTEEDVAKVDADLARLSPSVTQTASLP